MNREIKFRAWDNKNKCFVPSSYWNIDPSGQLRWNNDDTAANIIPLQFTGRTDINNNEIWEGDICKNQYNQIVVVRWINDLYWDGGGSSHSGFWFTHNKHINENEFDLDYHESFDNLEIIGNIYENPELLEE